MKSFIYVTFVIWGGWIYPLEALTPEEAARRAAERPALQQLFRSQSETLLLQERSRQLWQNPQVTINSGEKATGGLRGSTFGAALQFPVINPIRYEARGKILQSSEKLARLENELLRQQVAYEAYHATLALSAAREKAQHIRDRLRRMNLLRTYLQSRPFVSPRQQADRDIVQSRLILLQNHVRELEQEVAWWQNRLDYLTGEQNVIPQVIWPESYVLPAETELQTRLETENRELALLRVSLSMESQRAELYRTMVVPDFSVGSYYIQELTGIPERFYGLSFNFEIPLANRGQLQAQEAQARHSALTARLELRHRELKTELTANLAAFSSLLANYQALPKDQMRQLESQLDRAEVSFRQGKMDLITFLEMENSVHEALHTMVDLRLQLASGVLRLGFLCGAAEPSLVIPGGRQ